MPVKHVIPLPDLGVAGPIPILTAMEEEAIRWYHCDCHPYPHILHHARILLPPFCRQKSRKMLLHIPSLLASNAIHVIDQWSEVLVLPEAGVKVLILFLLLLCSNNLRVVPIPCRSGVGYSDADQRWQIVLAARIHGSPCPLAPQLSPLFPPELVVPLECP